MPRPYERWSCAVIALGLILPVLSACDKRPEVRTLYPARCSVDFVADRCPGSLSADPTEQVSIDVASQRVVQLTALGPVSLAPCTIFDPDDWSCEERFPEGTTFWRSMKAGAYAETASFPNPTKVRYVSGWSWWRLRLGI